MKEPDQTSYFEYDRANRVTSARYKEWWGSYVTATFTYNALGKLASHTPQEGWNTVDFCYDALSGEMIAKKKNGANQPRRPRGKEKRLRTRFLPIVL